MTISIDDRQLVESYQAGDTDAFAELVRGHGPSLLGHAMRKLGDRAAAEDAVQETFVRAYRALPRFDGDYRVGPWLHRILANVCADEGNRRRREAEKFDRFAADPFAADLAPGVEDELGLDFDTSKLADALASLPPSYREALNLRFVQELPYEEVARLAGVSEENARARVSRARSAARSALRGVAAIPALLIPALRRTETVAAASTQGDGVRVATETALASAPAAAPLITKAVVGISVVAAMVAPTSAPTEPDAGRALVAAGAVIGTDDTAVAEMPAPTSQAITVDQAPVTGDDLEVVDAAADSASGGPGAAPGGRPAPVAPPVAEAPATPADEPVEVAPRGGSIRVGALTLSEVGADLIVSGPVTLVIGEATHVGTLAGTLAATDQADLRRLQLDAVMVLDDGTSIDLWTDLQGRPVAEQADLPLAEVTAFQLIGPFRSAGAEALSLLATGTVTGSLDLAAGVLSLQLG